MFKLLNIDGTTIFKWLTSLVMSLWTYFAPIHDYATTILILIVVDTILGAWASKCKGQAFSITLFLKGFIKKFGGYFLALMVCFNSDTTLSHSWIAEHIKLSTTIGIAIIFLELKSILENVAVLTGVNLWELIKDSLATKLDFDKTGTIPLKKIDAPETDEDPDTTDPGSNKNDKNK